MFETQYATTNVPLVWRLALYAIDNHERPLRRGELWYALDPQGLTRSAEISRAIREAKRRRLITEDSDATVLRSRLLGPSFGQAS